MEGPYKIDKFGVCVGPKGEDYRIGDESPAEALVECMNDAFAAGRASLAGAVKALEDYVEHTPDCTLSYFESYDPDKGYQYLGVVSKEPPPCRCGLAATLRSARGEKADLDPADGQPRGVYDSHDEGAMPDPTPHGAD